MARVKCPGCDRSISLTPEHEGKKVKCKCGKIFRMPAPSRDRSAQAPARPVAAATATAPPPSPPIQFTCPTCMQLLQVDASFAGRLSACPCGTQVTVPDNVGLATDPLADPLLSEPLVSQSYGQPLASSVPAYHKRELANREKAARAEQRAAANRKKKKKRPAKVEHDADDAIAGSVWTGIVMMVGAAVWLIAGLMAGVLFFYPPVLFVIGLCTCVKGVLFGDGGDDW